MAQQSATIQRTVIKLSLATVAMFGFGFALVPLYDVFCDIAGIGGKTDQQAYTAVPAAVDTSREIKIQFITVHNERMDWEFKPGQKVMRVNPGALNSTSFFAKNPRDYAMIAQAIPSVQPARAAQYFHKTECFCFNQQTLAAGESADMPLRFIIDQDLPKDIKSISLSYTLFDVTDGVNTKPTLAGR